jgi:hypothetical protein
MYWVKTLLCSKVKPLWSGWAMLPLCVALVGCGRNEVKVYRVEKDSSPAAPQPADTAAQTMPQALPPGHPDVDGPGMPKLAWTLPSGWEEQAAAQMRVASFSIKGANGKQADVSIVPLAGMAGGDFANVNRWRQQVGMGPLTEDELKAQAQPVEVAGQPAQLYDEAGKNPGSGEPARILAAIQHRDGTTWFFKMTGDDPLVAEQKPAFIAFLKSLSLEAAAGSAGMPPSHPPVGGGAMPLMSASAPMGSAAPASDSARPAWQVPDGWQEVAAGQFLVAKFQVTGDGGAQAAVNVSASQGDGGGLVANLNRWCKQLGLAEQAEDEIRKSVRTVDVAGGQASFVEMDGTDARTGKPAKLAGAMVSQGGQTWFYKLMGDAGAVESQKDAFTKFVQGAKY